MRKRINKQWHKKFLALLVITTSILLCPACSFNTNTDSYAISPGSSGTDSASASQQTEKTEDSTNNDQVQLEAIRIALKKITQDDSNDLMAQFYRYYKMHHYELSMLPEFDENQPPDWDDLTIYLFINNAQTGGTAAANSIMTKEVFSDMCKRYLGDISYQDQSSKYLSYEKGVYTAIPGDTMWSGYYRLTDIAVDENDIYTASFDMLTFGELEFSDDYDKLKPNMKAVRDAAGVTGYEGMQNGVLDNTILNIFSGDDYGETFAMTEKTQIKFKLSENEDFPIIYLSNRITKY